VTQIDRFEPTTMAMSA